MQRQTRCFCGGVPVTECLWTGFDAGRRYQRYADGRCAYRVWLGERLDSQALGAIDDLFANHMRVVAVLEAEMSRVRTREAQKRERLLVMLRAVLGELEKDDV